jgi:hypothetical protein
MPRKNQGRKKITGHKGLNPACANILLSPLPAAPKVIRRWKEYEQRRANAVFLWRKRWGANTGYGGHSLLR